ncbi:MAG TPA: CARDB domain-containing protein [Saprospiraceae bacterium]|nr:CARDB domain-containing protein [Saprospiraceae bacterium]
MPDYNTIAEAVGALMERGACGPVVFNIRSGIYNEQVSIGQILGTDSFKTVTFQSETGDSSSVRLTFNAVNHSAPYTLRLTNTDWVIFRSITIEASNASLGRAVEINGSEHVLWERNEFRGSQELIYGTSSGHHHFLNNRFQGGTLGLSFTGENVSGHYSSGFVVEGNHFANQLNQGISAGTFSTPIMVNNVLIASTPNNYTGIALASCSNGGQVTGNKVAGVASGGDGINLAWINHSEAAPFLVANNFSALIGSSNAGYGLKLSYCNDINLYYNNLHVAGTNPNNMAFYVNNGGNITLLNNILANSGEGYAFYNAGGGIPVSNHNNLFTTGNVLGYWNGTQATDLVAWQSLTGKDANSLSIDPLYISSTDLHISQTALDGAGTPVAGVDTDIDGNPRDPVTPDIGAHEINLLPDDVGVIAILTPISACELTDSEIVQIRIQNYSSVPVAGFDVAYRLGSGNAIVENIGALTLLPGQTADYTFSTRVNLTGGNEFLIEAYTIYPTDVNSDNDRAEKTIQRISVEVLASHTNISCAFANNGAATAIPSGGTSPYTISWNNGSDDFSISNLSPGQYFAAVTDAHGCQGISNVVVVTEPAEIELSLLPQDAPCEYDGAISSTVSGGTAPYAWMWSNGQQTPNLSNIRAGSYALTITDARGCQKSETAIVMAQNFAPYFTFSEAAGFESSVVDPASGSPYETFRVEVRYFDGEGTLPQPGYPRLFLDYEGDGNLFGPNDLSFVLQASDPFDTDITDGKLYRTILSGIPPSRHYKTVIRAMDGNGCPGEFGPFDGPAVLVAPNISIFANDIFISDPNPEPLQTITVIATVRNESDFAAENFTCRLTNMNTQQVFPLVNVPILAPRGSTQVSWNIITPPDPSWNPLKVEIDVTNVIEEPNELDNQAIRPFINGDYILTGTIVANAQVQPNPSISYPNVSLSLSGSANYDGVVIPLTDPSCAGATVQFTISGSGQTYTGTTNESGAFSISFPQPLNPGVYQITGTITDYTLVGSFSTSFTVIPLPCQQSDLYGSIIPSRYIIVQGEQVQGSIRIYNAGLVASTPTQARLHMIGGSPDYDIMLGIPALMKDSFADIPFILPSLNTVGYYSLRLEIDPLLLLEECSTLNNTSVVNITVIPLLPDIAVDRIFHASPLYQCNENGFTYKIDNRGANPTGPFSVSWSVSIGGIVEAFQEQQVANIPRDSSVLLSFMHTFLFSNVNYTLRLSCDALSQVIEFSELNNVLERDFYVSECPIPVTGGDLSFYPCPPAWGYCPKYVMEPVGPGQPEVNISAKLFNKGNLPVAAPFEVELKIEDANLFPTAPSVSYSLIVNEAILPCQDITVNFTVPKPTAIKNSFRIKADALEQIAELDEGNNATEGILDWNFSLGKICPWTPMFWEAPVTSSTMWFSIGVFNAGYYPAANVPVKFEISGPGLNGWVNIGVDTIPLLELSCSCAPVASTPNPFTFLTAGTFTVRMTIDSDNQYPEWDESDNVLVRQVKILPDMQVLSQHIAPDKLNPDPNEPVIFTVTYENVGFNNPPDEMELSLFVDEIPFASTRVPGLLHGDHNSVEFSMPWSSSLVGTHIVRAVVDHLGEIEERDEQNNEATRAIVVGQSPNMRFVDFTVSNTRPSLGEILIVTAVIENNGDLSCTASYQLFFENDAGNLVSINSKNFGLQQGGQTTIQFPWVVTDINTVLTGKIVNSNPQEYSYTDNEVFYVIGGLDLALSSTPELCVPYTGTATAIASGGTPPYNYSWVNGQVGATASGLGAGSYSVTATDVNGLQGVGYVQVAQELEPEVSIQVTEASCEMNDGTATIAVTHAVEPYNIEWNNGATSADLSGLAPGRYGVTVTDAIGCIAEEEVIVGFDRFRLGASNACEVIIPQIFLSAAELNEGETQVISGENFIPNGKVALTVLGSQDLLIDTEVLTDEDGRFVFLLIIPAGISKGLYSVMTRDLISGEVSAVKYFQVIDTTIILESNIIITYPYIYEEFEAHSQQTIEWEELVLNKTGYPYYERYRKCLYRLEISKDGGPWLPLGSSIGEGDGYVAIGEVARRSFSYEIPSAETFFKIRIIDSFDETNFTISETFKSIASAAVVNYKWDYSVNNSLIYRPIRGISADGTARFFMEVYAPDLLSVDVELRDDIGSNRPDVLGKVMLANFTNFYHEEANDANTIVASGLTNAGKIVFWYVAPDDFCRSEMDNSRKNREVEVVFHLLFLDGTSQIISKKIQIVRPPLMLVHGLGGSPNSWNDMNSDEGLLETDARFIVIKKIKMDPTASFSFNSRNMVIGFSKNSDLFKQSSFQGVIEEMRRLGYATNRVDYIGHSMGGSILRNVLKDYYDYFLRTNSASNRDFKNYGKGYTNKVVTIGTPHEGSPWANFIERYLDDIPLVPRLLLLKGYDTKNNKGIVNFLFNFIKIKPESRSWNPEFELTDAVRDLRVSNGVSFTETHSLNAHLIAGDIIPGIDVSSSDLVDQSLLDFFEKLDRISDMSIIEDILKGADVVEILRGNTEAAREFRLLSKDVNVVNRVIKKIQLVFELLNIGAFLPESDFIVPISSQLAGLPKNSEIATVKGPLIHCCIFQNLMNSSDIGNEIIRLLNSSIISADFGPIPGSNPFIHTPSVQLRNMNSECQVVLTQVDTSRINLSSYSSNQDVFVDQDIVLSVEINDTSFLNWVDIYFQGKTYSLPTTLMGTYNITIPVSSNFLDEQTIYVNTYYSLGDTCMYLYDSIQIFVRSHSILSHFKVLPEVNYLFVGEKMMPQFIGQHSNGSSGEFSFIGDIQVGITNSNILALDSLPFRVSGVLPGETSVTFSYSGLTDTAHFIVLPIWGDTVHVDFPIASFTFSESSPCIGGDVHLENKSMYADTYHWDFGDGNTSTEFAPTYQYDQAGYHQVILTATNSETNQSSRFSVAIEVEKDSIDVSIEPAGAITLCRDSVITLVAESVGALTYQWRKDSIDLPDSTGVSILANMEGLYQVLVTNATGCEKLSDAVGVQFMEDDATAISIDDVTLPEGTGGTATIFEFTVTRNSDACPASVDYETIVGTATQADGDFIAQSGTLYFEAGESLITISVSATPDLDVEPDETFTVRLFNPVNAVLAKAEGLGAILNDDFDNDGDGFTFEQGDCDDDNPEAYPGALEICNGIDDNCNGLIDTDDEELVDEVPPAITCPQPPTLLLGEDCTASLPDYTIGIATSDNCGVQNVTQSPPAGTTVTSAGPMNVTLIVTDVNGLTNTCSFSVNKTDNTSPAIICPATQTLLLGEGCAASLPDYTSMALREDNCGVERVEQSPASGTIVSGAGSMTITLTVTDINGMTSICNFQVTKVDNTPPAIICPQSQVLLLGDDCTSLLPDYTNIALVEDNCGVAGVAQYPVPGALVSGSGSLEVTLTVTDIHGISADCAFTVNKVDNNPPTTICFSQTVTFNGENTIVLNPANLIDADDNCGIQQITLSRTNVSCSQLGQTIPVTVTATDQNGVTGTCISQITVNGLPCGWDQSVEGSGCTGGSSVSFNPASGFWSITSTNCYYASPFNADAFAWGQRGLCGDGSITTKVVSISGTGLGWAGIIMRENNSPGAKKVQLMTNLSAFSRREFRTVTGGQAYPQQIPSLNRYWLRIVRTGNQFSMYVSSNGSVWYFAGAQNITMNNCIQMGLVVTNYSANSTVTGTFSNVSYTGASNLLSSTEYSHLHPALPHVELFPNPTTGELNVDVSYYMGKALKMEVFNPQGQLIQYRTIDEVQTSIERLDLSLYESGVFFIRVRCEGIPNVTERVILSGKR